MREFRIGYGDRKSAVDVGCHKAAVAVTTMTARTEFSCKSIFAKAVEKVERSKIENKLMQQLISSQYHS